MSVDVWEPLRRLEEFDKVITGLFSPGAPAGAATTQPTLRPPVDYVGDAEGYSLSVDLPGVRKEDVDIDVEGDVLRIRAQRKPRQQSEAKAETESYVREIRSGTLQRSFRLAKDADTAAVSASLVDGVLEVRVPKQKKAQPRKVEIVTP
jgi:HSP20 family protein